MCTCICGPGCGEVFRCGPRVCNLTWALGYKPPGAVFSAKRRHRAAAKSPRKRPQGPSVHVWRAYREGRCLFSAHDHRFAPCFLTFVRRVLASALSHVHLRRIRRHTAHTCILHIEALDPPGPGTQACKILMDTGHCRSGARALAYNFLPRPAIDLGSALAMVTARGRNSGALTSRAGPGPGRGGLHIATSTLRRCSNSSKRTLSLVLVPIPGPEQQRPIFDIS